MNRHSLLLPRAHPQARLATSPTEPPRPRQRPPALLLLLLALLAGCQDRELPTAVAPEGAALDLTPGACVVTTTGDGSPAPAGSLREKIEDTSCTSITFDVTGEITLAAGELTIDRNLTISGPGAASLAVSGNEASRVFFIAAASEVSISGLTISGGTAPDEQDGGGIYNQGTLTLSHSTVSGNSVSGVLRGGGGIYNNGTLTLSHSTVLGNASGVVGSGGGISNNRGTLTISHSTLSGNTAEHHGGAIFNLTGTLTLSHSTVSGNHSAQTGGGIYSATSANFSRSTTILNSTISGNTASRAGGGIDNTDGLTRILHSTISGNRAPDGGGMRSWNGSGDRTEVRGSIIWGNTLLDGNTANDVAAFRTNTRYQSLGYNLIGAAGENVDFTQEFDQTGDQVNVADANLEPLALNAPGTTRTHALKAGSPAINAGICTDHLGQTVSTDQRGVSRPQPTGGSCDIGAYEASSFSFTGFFAPLNNNAVNQVKAGQAVPVKFSLGGDFGLDIFETGYPKLVFTPCLNLSLDPVETVTAGKSGLSYDAATQQYTYVWKTDKGWAGKCGTLSLKFTDGTTQSARFKFTK